MNKQDTDDVPDPCIVKYDGGKQCYVSGKTAYHCTICDCWMNSLPIVKEHLTGSRHKQNMNKQKQLPVSTSTKPLEEKPEVDHSSLGMSLIKQVADDNAVIGLGYITEYSPDSSESEVVFDCELCEMRLSKATLVSHVLSTKHRLAFLKSVNEDEYKLVGEKYGKRSDLTQEMNLRAQGLQKVYGPGRIVVTKNSEKAKPKGSSKRTDKDNEDEPLQKKFHQDSEDGSTLCGNDELSGQHGNPDENYMKPLEKKTWVTIESWAQECIISSDDEAAAAMRTATILLESLMAYKLKKVPLTVREPIEKALLSNNVTCLKDIIEKYNKEERREEHLMNSQHSDSITDQPMHKISREEKTEDFGKTVGRDLYERSGDGHWRGMAGKPNQVNFNNEVQERGTFRDSSERWDWQRSSDCSVGRDGRAKSYAYSSRGDDRNNTAWSYGRDYSEFYGRY